VTISNLPENFDFRSGSKGTHTSRTIMLDELTTLLSAVSDASPRVAYIAAIVEDNVLAKNTFSIPRHRFFESSEGYGKWMRRGDRYWPCCALWLATPFFVPPPLPSWRYASARSCPDRR
jgi:hypothetical protein